MKILGIFQKFGAILVILALFVQTFQNELIWADYMLETQHYAELCVNTAMPEMNCNGQCQMVKKMNHSDHDNQQNPQIQVKLVDIVLYVENTFLINSPLLGSELRHYPDLRVPETADFHDSILHPPIIA